MPVSGKGEEVMPYVSVEKKNAVAVVTIDRPEALNALNSEVLEALERAVDAVLSDESIQVIIFTGAGCTDCP